MKTKVKCEKFFKIRKNLVNIYCFLIFIKFFRLNCSIDRCKLKSMIWAEPIWGGNALRLCLGQGQSGGGGNAQIWGGSCPPLPHAGYGPGRTSGSSGRRDHLLWFWVHRSQLALWTARLSARTPLKAEAALSSKRSDVSNASRGTYCCATHGTDEPDNHSSHE